MAKSKSDKVGDHIEKLGVTYPTRFAGTPSSTGLQPGGFAVSGERGQECRF